MAVLEQRRDWAFDAAIEWVKLDGPFETGSVGLTKSHGQEPTSWTLVDVRSGEEAVIEMKLQDSVAQFAWVFEPVSRDRTHLHQQITLDGEAVANYSAEMKRAVAAGFIEGMEKLAQEIERACGRGEAPERQTTTRSGGG
ncbi:MAG TPA: hypothetical protein VKP65_19535 [Rhodothermales bacterium]|nr:hypothetical protein [Rhodothermales bacterium]